MRVDGVDEGAVVLSINRPNHSVPGCMKNQAIIAPFHEVPPEQISNTCIHSLFYHTHPHYTAFPLIYIL